MPDQDQEFVTELRPISEAESRPASRIIHEVTYSDDGGRYVGAVRQDLGPVELIEFPDHPEDNGPDRRVLAETRTGGLPEGKRKGSLSDHRKANTRHKHLRRKVATGNAERKA